MDVHGPALFHTPSGILEGVGTSRSKRCISELQGLFVDEAARQALDPAQVVYEVYMHNACEEVEGGLFFGVSHVYPGKVGAEYFMTKGHFHAKKGHGEYYWGIDGAGLLVLMNEQRASWTEPIFPGSLHYIPGCVAHRLVNTGARILKVGACWPADAGHDYASIQQAGFSVRVIERDGRAELVQAVRPPDHC